MAHIVVIDHPLPAAGIAALFNQHLSWHAVAVAPTGWNEAPPDALLLIEERLPDQQSGFRLAHRILHERPDLVPLLWSVHPAPIVPWAASMRHLPGVLDKVAPLDDLLAQVERAAVNRAAWTGEMLEEARQWDEDVAVRLRGLSSCHWALWHAVLRDVSTAEIAEAFGWARRTAERRLTELFKALGVASRVGAVHQAWTWGMIAAGPCGIEWTTIVEDVFLSESEPGDCE